MMSSGEINWQVKTYQEGSHAFGGPYWYARMAGFMSFGTEIDFAHIEHRTVTSGATDTIDFTALVTSLNDPLYVGGMFALVIINPSENTTNLTVSGAVDVFMGGTNPSVGPVRPGGMFAFNSQDAIATISDNLVIANSVGAVNNYVIGIIGVTGQYVDDDMNPVSIYSDADGVRVSIYSDDDGRGL